MLVFTFFIFFTGILRVRHLRIILAYSSPETINDDAKPGDINGCTIKKSFLIRFYGAEHLMLRKTDTLVAHIEANGKDLSHGVLNEEEFLTLQIETTTPSAV